VIISLDIVKYFTGSVWFSVQDVKDNDKITTNNVINVFII
jgi:hypothetical protein